MTLIPRYLGAVIAASLLALAGCSTTPSPTKSSTSSDRYTGDYTIAAGDSLSIHVRNNPDLSVAVPVRPDGKISVPMVQDVRAAGRTPTELAGRLESKLQKFIRTPTVTVMVTDFVGAYGDQVRVVGAAAQPMSLPYRKGMTVLDVIINAGGLTRFAAGNRAKLIRPSEDGQNKVYRLRLNDLIESGDISANRRVFPGDVVVIPETYF
jgi:polysaccharide export outer membrane protein